MKWRYNLLKSLHSRGFHIRLPPSAFPGLFHGLLFLFFLSLSLLPVILEMLFFSCPHLTSSHSFGQIWVHSFCTCREQALSCQRVREPVVTRLPRRVPQGEVKWLIADRGNAGHFSWCCLVCSFGFPTSLYVLVFLWNSLWCSQRLFDFYKGSPFAYLFLLENKYEL